MAQFLGEILSNYINEYYSSYYTIWLFEFQKYRFTSIRKQTQIINNRL